MVAEEATLACNRNYDLEAVERSCQEVLILTASHEDQYARQRRAGAYHELGIIAQERGQFGPAGVQLRRSLEIAESLGLEREVAGNCHQLGVNAQYQGQYEAAEVWLQRARDS